MAGENGNGIGGAPFGSYAVLNQRIESIGREVGVVERELRGDIARLDTKIGDQTQILSDKIERSQRSTNPYQLVLLMIAICGAAGAAGAYVAKNLSDNIITVNETLAKTISAVDVTLNKDIALNAKTIDQEIHERAEAERRIYDVIGKSNEAAWPKAAHAEYEKRIDEKDALERDYVRERLARSERDYDHLASITVPREDETQYRTSVTREIEQLGKTTADGLDRVTAHLNKSDERNEARASEIDKALHGYGLQDEVKTHDAKLQNMDDKIFQLLLGRLSQAGGATGAPKPLFEPGGGN